jgi:hypothetical protein
LALQATPGGDQINATINPGTVWNIVNNALPGLLSAVQTLLDELEGDKTSASSPD